MTEPRAQRTFAPADPPSSTATKAPVRPGFAPSEPFIVFAHATLARGVSELAAHWPQNPSAPTPDEIHQLRVAARRLRVALRLFRRLLPSRDVTRFRADLRWFARSLGDARDLDVYTESFKAYCSALPAELRNDLTGYELYLRRERAEARQRATGSLSDVRATALFAELARFVAAGPSAGSVRRWRSLTVRDGIRASIRASVNRVRRLGNRIDARSRPAEIHELRIKAKRLRYELEFFAEVYPHLRLPAKSCKSLQELLGSHQDAYTATARLRRYAALLKKQSGATVPLPAALMQLRRSQLALARQVRSSFFEAWPAVLEQLAGVRRAVV